MYSRKIEAFRQAYLSAAQAHPESALELAEQYMQDFAERKAQPGDGL